MRSNLQLVWLLLSLCMCLCCWQVARRMLHRPLIIYRMQNLKIIDGIPVMDEERAKAEMYFNDLQVGRHSLPRSYQGLHFNIN